MQLRDTAPLDFSAVSSIHETLHLTPEFPDEGGDEDAPLSSTGVVNSTTDQQPTTRSSLSLSSPDILRATTLSVLLGWFGARLRSSAGGIGKAAAEDEYGRSFRVDVLDIFLSHSWHAWWLLKYWTLLLYFNVLPAVVFALFAGLVVDACRELVLYNDWWHDSQMRNIFVHTVDDNKQATEFTRLRLTSLWVGGAVFYFVLFIWQRIRPFRSKALFLDKVCIHQTNARLKLQGIQSIGAFLANTKTVLIAWDKTYFERLWCVYELAAFKCCRPKGKIMLLPIMLGPTIALFSVVSMTGKVLSFASVNFVHGTWLQRTIGEVVTTTNTTNIANATKQIVDCSNFNNFAHCSKAEYAQYRDLCWYFWGAGLLCLLPFARRYGYSLIELSDQLSTFSAESAKCYCCCNDHKNPDTGEELPCDRVLVYDSIAHWHGGGNKVLGLQRFDKLVRTTLRTDIQETLGGWALVPYTLALSCSFWDGLISLDLLKIDDAPGSWNFATKLLLVLSRLFTTGPCGLALAIGVGVRFPVGSPDSIPFFSRRMALMLAKEIPVNICLTFGCLYMEKLHSDLRERMSRSKSVVQFIVISVIEILLPLFFFHSTVSNKCMKAFQSCNPIRMTGTISLRGFGLMSDGPDSEVELATFHGGDLLPTVSAHPLASSQ